MDHMSKAMSAESETLLEGGGTYFILVRARALAPSLARFSAPLIEQEYEQEQDARRNSMVRQKLYRSRKTLARSRLRGRQVFSVSLRYTS